MSERIVEALMADPDRERNSFIAEPDMDRIVAAILRLGMEVSVLRERLDAHEALAAASGAYGPAEVDAWLPDAETAKTQAERRALFIQRLVRDLT